MAAALLLIALLATPVQAAAEHYETVYDLTVANGVGYTEAFYPTSETTLYVLAGHPVVIAPRHTMVYYWATSGEWQPDWATLNEPIGTTLVVQGMHTVRRATRSTWVLSYPETSSAVSSESPATLEDGAKAEKAYQFYVRTSAAYTAAMDRYNAATSTYKFAVSRFLNTVGRLLRGATALETQSRRVATTDKNRSAALRTGAQHLRAAARRLPIPRQPIAPRVPNLYVTTPSQDFVVTLPVGRYQIMAADAHGHAIAGTRRQVVAIAPRRTAVGYTVIPADKWTSPTTLDDPAAALYVAHRATLYLQPFQEAEYNEYAYTKLTDPQNDTGRPAAWTWVHTASIMTAALRLETGTGSWLHASWRPYYVEQAPGSALGYTIDPFTPQLVPGQGPSFWAYRLVIPAAPGRLTLEEGHGHPSLNVRFIYPVRDPGPSTFAPAFLPLLVGFGVAFWRERRRIRHRQQASA